MAESLEARSQGCGARLWTVLLEEEGDQEGLLATGNAPHWERPSEVVRDLERFLRTTLA